MVELTATQKLRLALTGSPTGEPHFQHEGASVVRWLSSGGDPNAYVTFHHRGAMIEAHCPTCDAVLGSFPASYDGDTGRQIASIQRANHRHE